MTAVRWRGKATQVAAQRRPTRKRFKVRQKSRHTSLAALNVTTVASRTASSVAFVSSRSASSLVARAAAAMASTELDKPSEIALPACATCTVYTAHEMSTRSTRHVRMIHTQRTLSVVTT